MDEPGFWTVIEQCHVASDGDMGRKCELIASAIGILSKEDAADF